ncbi:MAG: LamG-like jellyroll fold domain-containing protein [Sphingobacteriaceae bacterium]|nr:LamG-like jellyroll fold domain-containing protein [Sphingobacteriaceae bacterium]
MKKTLLFFGMLFALQSVHAQQQNCIDFDGIDDYVEVSGVSAGLASLTGFSMACWVQPTNATPAFPNFDGIMGIRNELNADFFMLQLSATNFELRFRNSNGTPFTINSNTCQLNTWQHLALVYTGSQLRYYHNGALIQSISASGTITNTSLPLTLGRVNFQSNPFYLDGKLDEAAVWNRALSDSEVLCIAKQKINPLMSGLLHYYSMDQGTAAANNFSVLNVLDAVSASHGTMFGLALNGSSSNFVAGTTQMTVVQDTLCPGIPYLLAGQSFTQPGTYRLIVPAISEACDSTLILQLVADTVEVGITQSRDTIRAINTNATYQWLNCNNGFSPIAGATNATFIAPANGRYAVRVTENGCSDTSICVQVSTVGIKQLGQKHDFKLFPNPGNDFLQLQWPAELEQLEVKVFSTLGQLVYSGRSQEANLRINTEAWPAGMYYLQIQSNLGWSSLPWLKQ